jgi:hypothetical protein
MTFDENGFIVLQDGDPPLKWEVIEHIWMKAPDIYPGQECVCVGFMYEVGQCPYSTEEEFQVLINRQLDILRVESKRPKHPDEVYFESLIAKALERKPNETSM